jgi:hypothetical protein
MSDDPSLPAEAQHSAARRTAGEADTVARYQPEPLRLSTAKRAMFGFMAVMCFIVAAVLFGVSVVPAVAMLVFGGMMAYFAATGRRPADPSLAPASARFRELADPTRPLTREDLVPRGGDGDRPLRPERSTEG